VAHWLLFTCGYPFSGKSTLSAAIRDTFGFDLVSVDEQFTDPRVASWRDAYIAAYRALDEALSAGRSVVFDSVGHTRKHRNRLRRKARNARADSVVIWLCTSVAEAERRRQVNAQTPVRAHVPDDGFHEIVGQFEPLGPDESHLIYRPTETIVTWIERELRPMVERQD
jgi:predicted kinase